MTIEPNKIEMNREESNISQNSKCGTARSTKPNTTMRPPSRIPETVLAPIAPRDNIITPAATSRMYRLQPTQPNRRQGPMKSFGAFLKKSGDGLNSEVQMNAHERVAENNRLKVFESLHKKVRDMQTEFLSKFSTLKLSSPDKIKNEYKLISIVKNDACKLMVHDDFLTKFPKMIPSKTIGDLRQKIKTSMDESVMKLEKAIRMYSIKDPEIASKMEEEIKSLNADKERRLQEINEYITQLILQYVDDNIDPIIENLTKELDATKQLLQDSEDRRQVEINVNEQKLADLKDKLTDEFNDMICKKEQELEEIQLKAVELEHINEELQTKVDQLENENQQRNDKDTAVMENMLKVNRKREQFYSEQSKELQIKWLSEKEENLAKDPIIENLRADLEAALDKIKQYQFDEKKTQALVEQLMQKVCQQKDALDSLEMQKVSMQDQVDKLKAEAENAVLMQKQLGESKIHIEELEQDILRLNTAIETLTVESNTELNKLRESEAAKIREIDELKSELTKCETIISQLKEEKLGDRQLLNVHGELINALQTECHDSRNQLERKSTQLLDKDNKIEELNTDLQSKSEELRNLFTMLRKKESQIAHQTHLIDLLMDCRERNGRVRVHQESKVSTMEDQIIQLKETIAYYQAEVLEPCTTSVVLTTDATSTPSEAPAQDQETPDLAEQVRDRRCRKRETKIKVKQYQT